MILGSSLTVREKELATLLESKSDRTYDVRFQGKLRPFQVYRVRLELPKYRLENGRTSAAQSDYIAKNGLEPNFFDISRSENSEVQEAQHIILTQMARNSDPDKDLFKFFAKREQEQPLILDHLGFVINGNRRLATFREINDPEKDYSGKGKFNHIDVVILPPCDLKDIDELEAHLQVEKDIKQEYSWISLALTIRQKLQSNQYTPEQMQEIYDLSEKEMKANLQRLTLAESYLDSRNKHGQYLELEKTQLAFEQLQKYRPKLASSPAKQDLFSEISYRLIDSRQGDRVYASIPDALEVIDEIKENLINEVLGDQFEKKLNEINQKPPLTLFGPQNPVENNYIAVFKALKDCDKDDEIHHVIINAIDSKKDREKAVRKGNAACDSIRKANTALQDAVNMLSEQSTKEGISSQLDSIIESVGKIRNWLND